MPKVYRYKRIIKFLYILSFVIVVLAFFLEHKVRSETQLTFLGIALVVAIAFLIQVFIFEVLVTDECINIKSLFRRAHTIERSAITIAEVRYRMTTKNGHWYLFVKAQDGYQFEIREMSIENFSDLAQEVCKSNKSGQDPLSYYMANKKWMK